MDTAKERVSEAISPQGVTHTPVHSDKLPDKTGEWDWHEIVARLQLKGMAGQLANHCLLEKHKAGMICLTLDRQGEQLRTQSTENELLLALQKVLNETLKLTITTAAIAAIDLETPDKRQARVASERQLTAEDQIINDPFVQALQVELGAEIIPASIKIKK